MSSIAPGGMEMPVRRYSSAFQPKCTNSRSRPRSSLMCSRTRIPAPITSGPMPSPGTTAIFLLMAADTTSCSGGQVLKINLTPHQVTNEEYARFLDATGHEHPPTWGAPHFDHPRQPVVSV